MKKLFLLCLLLALPLRADRPNIVFVLADDLGYGDLGASTAQVNELGFDEKTLLVFTSDNGPLYDELGGTGVELFNSHSDLRRRKGSFFEGG